MEIKAHPHYKTILQHLLFWLAFILYQHVINNWEDTDALSFQSPPNFWVLTLPMTLLLTYLNLYVLMPLYYYRQRYFLYGCFVVLMLIVGGLLKRYITHAFIIPWEAVHDPERYRKERLEFWIPIRIIRISLEEIPVIAITMLIQLMRRAYIREKHFRELEKEKFLAEMGLLKAQINPHFFFNTLNSLYALTLRGSEQASKVVLRLSNLMHYMLYEARANKVLLEDEINHLENYISIEQMRFADRLDLSFQHSGDISGKMIAPLLLLPFIENAFKHGISDGSGWITINLKVIENKLFLKVANSYQETGKKSGHGLGLENARRRLELSYPGRHELQLRIHPEIFEADLKLEL